MKPEPTPSRPLPIILLAGLAALPPLSPLHAHDEEQPSFRNRNLDDATSDALSAVRPEVVFEIAFEAIDRISAFLEFEASYRAIVERGRDRDREADETYRFAKPLQLSLTLVYAYGSGNPDASGGVDRQFRQTGLQDNTYRFNGVENFRYYGETLNPDLSNLAVFTAGIGIRPTERSSIDLTYHLYRQDEAAAGRLPGARVSAETNGESRDIGQGRGAPPLDP